MEQGNNEKNLLVYIGMFEVGENGVSVCDPYVNGITIRMEKIPSRNEVSVNVDDLVPGVYYAYHQLDGVDGRIVNLLVVHKEANVESLFGMDPVHMGDVPVNLGHAVVVADRDEIFNSMNCYFAFQEDAYYSCDMLSQNLPLLKDEFEEYGVYEELQKIVDQSIKSGIPAIKGEDIMRTVGGIPLGESFRQMRMSSSQWSVEVLNSIYDSYNYSVAVKGGIASLVSEDLLSVYAYAGSKEKSYCAICVTL